MFRQLSVGSEDIHTSIFDIKIKKRSIITSLFPENGITICVPLDAPFDSFAITNHGDVFLYRPLKTILINNITMISPSSVCIPKYKPSGRSYVTLPSRYGISFSFFIDTLMLHYFKNEPLHNKLKIFYIDNDFTNLHINNLYTENS